MSTSKPPALWRVLFLAEHYGRMVLTLDEIAEQIGVAPGTIKNRRTRGEFTWLRTDGRTLTADVATVAAFLDQRHLPEAVAMDRTWMTTDALAPRTQRAGPRRRKRTQGEVGGLMDDRGPAWGQ